MPSALAWQGPLQEQKPVQLKSQLVQVDAVVTDKNFHPVTNLRKEDFVLLEDGKPQQVSFFSSVTKLRGVVPVEGEKKKSIDIAPLTFARDVGPIVVFVIDDLHLSTDNFVRLRRPLLDFIDRELSEDDQVALVTTGGQIGMLQQLSRNKLAIRRAVMRFSPKGNNQTASPVKALDENTAFLIDRGDKEVLDMVLSEAAQELLPSTSGPSDPRAQSSPEQQRQEQVVQQIVESAVATVLEQTQLRARQSLRTLTNIIRDLDRLAGRKMVVLVSDGFLSETPGLTTVQEGEQLTDAATRAGVVIYTIDSRGLVVPAPGGNADERGAAGPLVSIKTRVQVDSLEESRRILRAIAADTGGRAFFNSNSLPQMLNSVFEDNAAFYVLAYYPEDTERDGKFRRIELKIKGRNDLIIRTRRGYIAAPPDSFVAPVLDKEEAITRALASPVSDPDIYVALSTAFLYEPGPTGSDKKGKTAALVSAHFNTAWLGVKAEGDKHVGEVEVDGFAYDPDGKLVTGFSRTVKLQMRPRTRDFVDQRGIVYKDSFELPPGLYNIHVAVVDPKTLKVGTANDWIEIPDMSKRAVEIGGLLTASRPRMRTVAASGAQRADASTPANLQVLQAEWPRDAEMDLVAIVYSKRNPRELRTQVSLLKNNQVVLEGPEQPVTPNGSTSEPYRVPVGARLSLAGLLPGHYTVRVQVRGNISKETVVRESTIVIR